uniref:Uncharacterized protein n=1 Tax=uncultured marine virus TaxID=186617 RepID=A0A0F7L849_9VIRU|nr:hypothetical protein [uncultured marine virus]
MLTLLKAHPATANLAKPRPAIPAPHFTGCFITDAAILSFNLSTFLPIILLFLIFYINNSMLLMTY